MKYLLLTVLLCFMSCGSKHRIEVELDDSNKDRFFVFENQCFITVINDKVNNTFLTPILDLIKCRSQNFVTGEYLSEVKSGKEVLRNGEVMWSVPYKEMLRFREFLEERGVVMPLED